MENKKFFAELEIVSFDNADVITTSFCDFDCECVGNCVVDCECVGMCYEDGCLSDGECFTNFPPPD